MSRSIAAFYVPGRSEEGTCGEEDKYWCFCLCSLCLELKNVMVPTGCGPAWVIYHSGMVHADKITRPLMAVLLPKATIIHDCIDMEF